MAQIPNGKGQFLGGKGAHCKVWGLSAVSCAITAEPIDLPFTLWTQVGRRKHKCWRNLANTIEPSVCCSDVALCQITLTTCYDYYYVNAWFKGTLALLGMSFSTDVPSVTASDFRKL